MLVNCHKHRMSHTLGLKILMSNLITHVCSTHTTCCINSFVVSKWVIALLLYNSFQDQSFTAQQNVWLILASSFIYAINSAIILVFFLTETSKFIGDSQTYDMKNITVLNGFLGNATGQRVHTRKFRNISQNIHVYNVTITSTL